MTLIKRIYLLLFIVGCAFTLVSCSAPNETYGAPISNKTLTPIQDFFNDVKGFDGKQVTIQGTILTECPSGEPKQSISFVGSFSVILIKESTISLTCV